MMEWAFPWAFLLVPLALFLPLQPKITGTWRVAVASIPSMQRRFTLRLLLSWLPMAMRVVGLLLVVVALARPRFVEKETIVESEGLDIMLAVDTSCSMEEEDFSVGGRRVNRLDVAKAVVKDFIDQRPHDRIGLVVFGEKAFTYVPLTLDHGTLQDTLALVESGIAGSRGTAIGEAVAVASKRVKDLKAPAKIVIVLTDGQNNAGKIWPIPAAQAAGALGIKVYTVGVGGSGGGGIKVLGMTFGGGDGIDEATLTEVARLTDARYFRATDTKALKGIFEAIDELEPSPAEVEEFATHTELFHWALGPALALLALDLLLASTWLRRGP